MCIEKKNSLWKIKNYQPRCFSASFPESIKTMLFLAGILTYPSLNAFPSDQQTVAIGVYSRFWKDFTAAGLFRTCTWFPFHRIPIEPRRCETKNAAKIYKKSVWTKKISENVFYNINRGAGWKVMYLYVYKAKDMKFRRKNNERVYKKVSKE